MAKLDENGLLYLWQRFKSIFATKDELNSSKITVENNLSSESESNALAAKQGKVLDEKIKALSDSMGDLGYGDMMKATYDTDNNGKVDNADNADNANKLGGQSPDYYARAADIPTDYAKNAHTHQQSEVVGLGEAINTMTEIAQGKCKSYTFDTVDELDTWLTKAENTAVLNTGDVFLIRAVDVPDYWWDGDTNTKQILETTKVDLSAITNAEIDAILAT